jgi:hypothetical protein
MIEVSFYIKEVESLKGWAYDNRRQPGIHPVFISLIVFPDQPGGIGRVICRRSADR